MRSVVNGAGQEVLIGFRRLRAAPVFAAFGVLSVTIGIGLTTACFSVIAAVFWRAPGFEGAERVAAIVLTGRDAGGPHDWRSAVSIPDFEDVARQQTAFSRVAATAAAHLPVQASTASERALVEGVSPAYFETLGVRAVVGRTFRPEDEHDLVAVLGYDFWQTVLGGDPTIIGSSMTIEDTRFEVIGIAAKTFPGLGGDGFSHTAAWVPLGQFAAALPPPADADRVAPRARRAVSVIGRLKESIAIAQAAAEARLIAARLDRDVPLQDGSSPESTARGQRRWSVVSLEDLRNEGRPPSRVGSALLALVSVVLLVACTNLVNLMLSRGGDRRAEFAIRAALGASRWRLVRQQCIETALLTAAGAAGAVLLARVVMYAFATDVPVSTGRVIRLEPVVDLPAVGFATLAVLGTVIIVGLVPAIELSGAARGTRLAFEAAGAPKRRHHWLVLRCQTALTTALFLVGLACIQFVLVGAAHDCGIAIDQLAVAIVRPRAQGAEAADRATAHRVISEILERARTRPQISHIAASAGLPFGIPTPLVFVAERADALRQDRLGAQAVMVCATTSVFDTLGLSFLRGRPFGDKDGVDVAGAAVIAESTALAVFGDVDVVGRDVFLRVAGLKDRPPEQLTVAGVVRDTDVVHFRGSGGGVVYVPLSRAWSLGGVSILARGRAKPSALAADLRELVQQADPGTAVRAAGPARLVLAPAYEVLRYIGTLALVLGVCALLLSSAGLYGVLSQVVTARTREIGVRVALGATPRQVTRLIAVEGLRPVTAGLAVGIGLGAACRVIVQVTLNQSIRPIDPWTAVVMSAIFLASGALASCLPARRAARLEPTEALRES